MIYNYILIHNTGNPPLPAASTSSNKLHGESIIECSKAKRKVNKKRTQMNASSPGTPDIIFKNLTGATIWAKIKI